MKLLPLCAATALAFRRLVKEESRHGLLHADGVLDVVAIALATCIPVYSGGRPLTHEELACGEFRRGATRLRFDDGRPPAEDLAVRPRDLDYAIERLSRAGVSFSHALFHDAPRRLPRVVPA